jgi:hypothetical protein
MRKRIIATAVGITAIGAAGGRSHDVKVDTSSGKVLAAPQDD